MNQIHCSICYDDFGVDTITNKKIVSQCVVCKTIFHKTCLTKWFNYNKTCPFCRTPNNIKSSSLFKTQNYVTHLEKGFSIALKNKIRDNAIDHIIIEDK